MSPLGLDVAFVERSPWEFFPLGDDGHFIGQTILADLQRPLLALVALSMNQGRTYYPSGNPRSGRLNKHTSVSTPSMSSTTLNVFT